MDPTVGQEGEGDGLIGGGKMRRRSCCFVTCEIERKRKEIEAEKMMAALKNLERSMDILVSFSKICMLFGV